MIALIDRVCHITIRRPLVARTAALLTFAVTLASCAPGFAPPPRPAPSSLPLGSPLASRTLSDGDAWLRHYLMVGEHDAALELLARSSAFPDDKLLRRLQAGVVLHHAGRYEESNRAFEWAEREADRRYTKSLSRAAGSLLVSDRVLAYSPSRAEVAAIPYYRMLNYLALGDLDGAAVEARKASAWMGRVGGDGGTACAGNPFLHYLSGLVFDAAGDVNSALVSFRQAERSFDACADGNGIAPPAWLGGDLVRAARALGFKRLADSATARYGEVEGDNAAGELVILIEQGFVAHRAEENLYIPIFAGDIVDLNSGDARRIDVIAGQIAARLHEREVRPPRRGSALDDVAFTRWGGYGKEVAHILKLAWPVSRLEASRAAAVRVSVDSTVLEPVPVYNLSALQARALESRRALLVSRMITRGLVKYLISREVEETVEEEGGETAALLVGWVVNTAANALERADTRSWSLLPDGISIARVRLPPGEHTVRLDVLASDGYRVKTIELGPVSIGAGERIFLSRRVWGRDDGIED